MSNDLADRAEELLGLAGDQAFQDWRAANPAHYRVWRKLAHTALTDEGRTVFGVSAEGEPATDQVSTEVAVESVYRPWDDEHTRLLAGGTPLGDRYQELMEKAGSVSDEPDGWATRQRLMEETDLMLGVLVWRNVAGKELEKAGELDQARALYEANIEDRFHGGQPYERLRILYTKERRYKDAIRVCEAYLEIIRDAPAVQAEYRRKIRVAEEEGQRLKSDRGLLRSEAL